MKEHLITEKAFGDFLNTLCCNHCTHFKNNKCHAEKAGQHEIEKIDLMNGYMEAYSMGWKATPNPDSQARIDMLNGFKEAAEDINNYFVCTDYKFNK
jgi:hypothetical protein